MQSDVFEVGASDEVATTADSAGRQPRDDGVTLVARVDNLEDENETLREENMQLREENEELRARVDDVEDDQDTHGMRLDALSTGIESVNDDIAELEDSLADANLQGNGGERAGAPAEDWTPIERNALMDHDELKDYCGPSDRRGVMIFKHWQQWSTNTPKGQLMKTGDDSLRSLLSTACDEHLSWKQVYRACRRVEQLSKGAITFYQHDKHGHVLHQHRPFASRQAQSSGGGDGSLSASSAGT